MNQHPVIEKIVHKVLLIFAVIIVFCAVVFTITRALTPLLNAQKTRFESLVTHLVGTPVTFNKIAFGWHGIEPEMLLQGVTIYKSGEKVLRVGDLYIALDPIRSLLARKITPGLITISGVKVSIKHEANGHYRINDLTIKQASGNQKNQFSYRILKEWMLAQNKVYLKNIAINYTTQRDKKLPILLKSLSFTDNEAYHQLGGVVEFFLARPTAVNFVMQAKGNLINPKQLSVKIYVDAKNIDLGRLLLRQSFAGYRVKQGFGEVKTWLSWHNDRWQNVVSQFNLYDTGLYSKKSGKTVHYKGLSGVLSWRREKNGWRVSGDHLNLISEQRVWPATRFLLAYQKASGKQPASWWGSLSFVNLSDVSKLALGSNKLTLRLQNLLTHFSPAGVIQGISFSGDGSLKQPVRYHLQASLSNFSTRPWQNIPGIKNLSGRLQFSNHHGWFHLNTNAFQLDFPRLFEQPLLFSQTKGEIHWKMKNKTLTIKASNVVAVNNDLGFYGQCALRFLPGQPKPYISLLAGIYTENPAVLKKYIPLHVMSQHTVHWLKTAILGGKSVVGKVVLRGNMKNFPFLEQQGVFRVQLQLKGLNLRYAPRWPALKDVSGRLLFVNNGLKATITSGHIFDASIQNLSINIPSLHNPKGPHLYVDGVITDSDKGFTQFIHQSPLAYSLGDLFKQIQLTGQSAVNLYMDVPLNNVKNTQVKGRFILNGDNFYLPAEHLLIKNIRGALNFTKHAVSAKKITGTLFGEPLVLNAATVFENNGQRKIDINFNSILSMDKLKQQYGWLNHLKLYGSTNYKGSLAFYIGAGALAQNQLSLHSSLYGLNVAYPRPMGKLVSEVVPLTVNVQFGQQKPVQLFATYGDRIHSALLFKGASGDQKFFSGLIHFGSNLATLQAQPGLVVDGFIPVFHWQQWRAALTGKQNKTPFDWQKHQQQFASILRYVDLNVADISVLGVSLKAAEFKLSHANDEWLASLSSNAIQGSLSIPDIFPRKAIAGTFERIYLPSLKAGDQQAKFNPGKVPPLRIQVNDFRYTNKDFGAVRLNVWPKGSGLTIKNLSFDSPLFSGDVSGQWQLLPSNKYKTTLSGWLNGSKIGALLKMWDVKSNILLTSGHASFDLSWAAAPFMIDPTLFNGSATLKLGHGWFVGLSQSTAKKLSLGRAINILSVSHLFDIDDLDHKGYSFNSLTGKLKFNSGVLSTNNFRANGAEADIHAKGWLNLIKKSIDMKFAIIVNVTGSLPVIAAVATGFNPIVGALTWIVDKIVHKARNATAGYGYKVVGPWAKPKVIKLS